VVGSACDPAGVGERAKVSGVDSTLLVCALEDLAGLGSWPGDPRYEWAIDPIRLRIEVLDAVALIVQNPGVSARARDLADQTLAEGCYERVPGRPVVMPTPEEQTVGVGWCQWWPGDMWHYGPDEPHWPGPDSPQGQAWLTRYRQIWERYLHHLPLGVTRGIVRTNPPEG